MPSPPRTPIAESDLTEADKEFLRQIAVVDGAVLTSEQLLVELLSHPQLTREELFRALSEAPPDAALSSMAYVAIQLRPGDALRPDYERYVAYLSAVAADSRGLPSWIASGDLRALHHHTVEIGVARGLMAAEVSLTLCGALASASECPDELPMLDDYGAALRAAFRALHAQVEPRIRFFPPLYDDEFEERIAATTIISNTNTAFRHTHGVLLELEPPPALRADHERLRQFLVDAAEAFSPPEFVQPGVKEVQTRQGTLETQKADTAAELSPAALEIVAPFFPEASR